MPILCGTGQIPMNRHNWRLVARDVHTQKHQCTRCLLVRLTASTADSFPTRKYVGQDGFKQIGGQTPECIA
jgi:hypothetical protein